MSGQSLYLLSGKILETCTGSVPARQGLPRPILTMVPHVLPFVMVEVREYLDQRGHSPFAAWSDRLNREAAAKVAAALARIQQGKFSNKWL
jgi:hypothetical protein